MPGLLEGKHILVTGVLTDDSLAFGVARLAQEQGAEVILTGAGRGLSLTRRIARKLPDPPDVLELDVTVPEQVGQVAEEVASRWGKLDGLLHSIGFAPENCLGGGFLDAGWDDVKVAIEISAYSLKLLAAGFRDLLRSAGGASVVGLDFDASVAWPGYDWMGVAKAALESTARYLARDLGADAIRINLVAAGPIKTMAAKSIPGFSRFEEVWDDRSPLGWSVTDSTPVARACVALLSDWFPATTGEILHVDGGYHAMGV
jgi:enoyl-[acyl-carrier protein] reductase I